MHTAWGFSMQAGLPEAVQKQERLCSGVASQLVRGILDTSCLQILGLVKQMFFPSVCSRVRF